MWALMLLLGCDPTTSDVRTPDTDAADHTDAADDSSQPEPLSVSAPPVFALPYAEVGDPEPRAPIQLTVRGSGDGTLAVRAEGPFHPDVTEIAVHGGTDATITVTADLGTDGPGLASGRLFLDLNGEPIATIRLGAAIGDPDLGPADWQPDTYGERALIAMPSAPYPDGSGTWDDPTVLFFVPTGLTDRDGVDVVTHLHGHNATVPDTIDAQYLTEQHALSGRDALFIAPQGPVEYPSGDFGRLMDDGGHARLIRDAITVLYRDGFIQVPEIGEQAVTSHSGGYLATAAILQRGGLPISSVLLYDSLYGQSSVYKSFALDGGVFRSNWTSGGGTDANNRSLAADLTRAGVDVDDTFFDDDLTQTPVSIGGTWSSHGSCMYVERSAARWLATSGLPRRPNAPPELRFALDDGRVAWRDDAAPGTRTWRVETSTDGVTFATAAETAATTATITPAAFVRVRAIEDGIASDPSDVYGNTGRDTLIVDGFDRVLGGSYTGETQPFAAIVGHALTTGFATASNEAVATGEVKLGDYRTVIWLLGDESSYDLPFSDAEERALSAYVAGGGRVIVSGSEAAYADKSFVGATLHATFVSDDAASTHAGGYAFGVAYAEDYPDVLSGEKTIWSYDTGGAAAVVWQGRVVMVGFPIETIAADDLSDALAELVAALR
jgi:hypothetical protein